MIKNFYEHIKDNVVKLRSAEIRKLEDDCYLLEFEMERKDLYKFLDVFDAELPKDWYIKSVNIDFDAKYGRLEIWINQELS